MKRRSPSANATDRCLSPCVTIRCCSVAKRFQNAALCVPATCKCMILLPSTGFLHDWISDARTEVHRVHCCQGEASAVVPGAAIPGIRACCRGHKWASFPSKDPSSGYVDTEPPCQKKSNVEKTHLCAWDQCVRP